jgi:predicted GIY-YIG superfamily endonuclease
MAFCVYMLRCSDGSIYTGHTENLEARLYAHQDGRFRGCTHPRRPVKLIFCEDFPTRQEAFEAERQIKGWVRRKKFALAQGDWEELRRLAHQRGPAAGERRAVLRPSFDSFFHSGRTAQDEREGASSGITPSA